MPENYQLFQNYPNPFSQNTTVRFVLPEAAEINLKIYNVRGQLVKTLVSGQLESGFHSIAWDGLGNDGKRVASGLYIYRLQTSNHLFVKKMLFVK